MTGPTTARERIAQLTRSFDERDQGLRGADPLAFEGYDAQLARARSETGLDEACVWGWADIDGERCALVVFDFAFLGGSMGIAVGDKVARAFDAARRSRAPIVTVTASGGARMQEGMWSLVQMAKTVEAHRAHAAAGLVHITLLTSPTTGGVYASFASLADVIYAEPGSTVGFAGPRVVEELTGVQPQADVHTAKFAFEHGLVDAIVTRERQTTAIGHALRAFVPRRSKTEPRTERHATVGSSTIAVSAWERLQTVRGADWPKAADVLDALLVDAVELRGDRVSGNDDHIIAMVGGLIGSRLNVVAIGQDSSGDGRIRPQGFRKAVRAIELAGRLGVPLLSIIDTRGADPSPSSEASGLASSIARTFEAMLGCPSPTLAVLTGEGGSGGALAMAVADRVIAWESATFSVIAPEGAATILYRDPERAPELAERMRITSGDLGELGFVDVVIPEPEGGVPRYPEQAMELLTRSVTDEVERLVGVRPRRRLVLRHRRWRGIASGLD